MKGDAGHVVAATLEPQSSVSVAELPRPSICPCALKGTFVPPQGSFRTHTHTRMKKETSTPSSDWTNGHLVTLSEALQEHFNRLVQ